MCFESVGAARSIRPFIAVQSHKAQYSLLRLSLGMSPTPAFVTGPVFSLYSSCIAPKKAAIDFWDELKEIKKDHDDRQSSLPDKGIETRSLNKLD